MGNTKAKTIDEFFIEKYEELERENEDLKVALEINYKRQGELIQERDGWKNEYKELIAKLKEDFKIVLRYSNAFEGEKIISADNIIFEKHEKEKYDYYKKLFNLKEEGEENE